MGRRDRVGARKGQSGAVDGLGDALVIQPDPRIINQPVVWTPAGLMRAQPFAEDESVQRVVRVEPPRALTATPVRWMPVRLKQADSHQPPTGGLQRNSREIVEGTRSTCPTTIRRLTTERLGSVISNRSFRDSDLPLTLGTAGWCRGAPHRFCPGGNHGSFLRRVEPPERHWVRDLTLSAASSVLTPLRLSPGISHSPFDRLLSLAPRHAHRIV